MSNYVSAIGSNVDALILCATDMTINGRNYIAGEPFTYLSSIIASVSSSTDAPQMINNTPSSHGLRLVDAVNYIDQLTLSNVPYTTKIRSLFFQPTQTKNNIIWKVLTSAHVKLLGTPTKIFFYCNGELKNDGYTVSEDWFTINDYVSEDTYWLGYYYVDNALCSFKSENYPYFTVVLYAKGNAANKTLSQTFIFEKVALIPQTALQFLPSAQNFVTLSFGVIDAEKTVSIKI